MASYSILSLSLTGIIVGFIIKYIFPQQSQQEFFLAQQRNCTQLESTLNQTEPHYLLLQLRENVVLQTQEGDEFLCEVLGKVFRDEETGNYIQQSVSTMLSLSGTKCYQQKHCSNPT